MEAIGGLFDLEDVWSHGDYFGSKPPLIDLGPFVDLYRTDNPILEPDPFLDYDRIDWSRFQINKTQQDQQLRFNQRIEGWQGFVIPSGGRKPKHPLIEGLKPGLIVTDDGRIITNDCNSRHPMVYFVRDNTITAIIGLFTDVKAKDRIVPQPLFQPTLPSEESRIAFMQFMHEWIAQLSKRLAPVPIVKIDWKNQNLVEGSAWMELTKPGRLVIPMSVTPQDELTEWLTEEIDQLQRRSVRSNALWTTKRIANRVSRLTVGLKPEKKSRLSSRLKVATDIFHYHALKMDQSLFPHFLLPNSGAHALVLNLGLSDDVVILWQMEIGRIWTDFPFLKSQLSQVSGRQALTGRVVKANPQQEKVFAVTSYPAERARLREILEVK